MFLYSQREPTIDDATLGVLFVDGAFECFTLEDVIREPSRPPSWATQLPTQAEIDTWVRLWKVDERTAIPSGTYDVRITLSPHLRRRTIELVDVAGFSSIRCHAGNKSEDTKGCILPGRVREPRMVLQSKLAEDALCAKVERALVSGERVRWRFALPIVGDATPLPAPKSYLVA